MDDVQRTNVRDLSCPGGIIREWMDDNGQSGVAFSSQIGISAKHLSQIMNGHVRLSYEIASRIESATGMPATLLLKMDYQYWMEE